MRISVTHSKEITETLDLTAAFTFTSTVDLSLCSAAVSYAAALIPRDIASYEPLRRRPPCCFCV